MEESHSNDDIDNRLTTVSNPDLSEIKKPTANLTFKDSSTNSYQDTNSAIVVSWIGIIVAGGLYPILVISGGWLFMVFSNGLSPDLGIDNALAGILWLFFPAILGMFLAAISSALSCLFTVMINWTFGNIFSPRIAVSVCGGLAGFLATLPIWLGAPADLLAFTFFSVLAMVMGHIGAIYSVWKIDPALLVRRPSPKPNYQFQIRHMLVATAWFAVIAALDGISGEFFLLAMLATWLVAQVGLIAVDVLWLKLCSSRNSMRISPPKTSL